MWVIMSKKEYFYDGDDFTIWYEKEQGELLVHIYFSKVSKSILEKALEVWAKFKAQAYFAGYERILTYTKDERVFKWFPFATKKGEIGPDNYKLGVWQWDLN